MADYSANLTPIYRISKFLDRLVHGTDAPEPVFRIEFYLAKLAGQDVEIPEPIYRIEFYLAKLCGMDVEIPVPIYRAEFYLAKLCGEEVTPPEVIYRISHWLADWAESGGGGAYYTLAGTLPLTLPHSLAAAIRSLVRTGAMTQSPAPTPDAPVYPSINNGTVTARRESGLPSGYQRVEYLGSDSKAYLDTGIDGGKDTYTVECEFQYDSYIAYGAVYGNYVGDSWSGIRFILDANENFGLVCNNTMNSTGGNTQLPCAIGQRHTLISKYDTVTLDGVATEITRTATGTANTNRIALLNRSLTNPNTSRNIGLKVYSFRILDADALVLNLIPCRRVSDGVLGMFDLVSGAFLKNVGTGDFTAGDTIAEPVDIIVDGTPETLTVVGNLLSRDGETEGKIINSNGTVSENANYCISAPFVLPAGNYTCTWGVGVSGSRPFSVFAVDESGTPQPDGKLFYQGTATAGINTGEFTVAAQTRVVASYRRNVTDLAIYTAPQTATVPDLYAVGDYRDEVDVVAGPKTRKVGMKVLDGTEPFSLYQSSCWAANVLDDPAKVSGNAQSICSHYAWTTSAVSGMADGTFLLNGTARLCIKDSRFETAAQFRAELAAQYAAGTPVIVWYPLATPTTESITPQALRTVDGSTVVSSSAGSVGATVEYKASQEPTAAEPTSGLMMAMPSGEDGGAADGS